jgi:mannosyltransferase
MSSVATRPFDRIAARPSAAVLTVAGLTALVAVSAALRTTALNAGFWIDEGLSVGIASYDFFEIPGRLREDGSPPLYYLLLHLWMQAFGVTETATHVLSLIFALLAVPAAWWAGRSVFGQRAGWVAAVLAALNPFLTYYAQETRMYALSVLLGLLVAATFLHAFVRRDRRYLPAFAAALTAMLYTHNWALFLGTGTVAAVALLWRWGAPEDRRGLVRDGLLAYGAVALLYAPWVPTLIFQALHTGAPWAERPSLEALLSGLGIMLGGAAPAIGLLLAGGTGLNSVLGTERDRRVAALIALTASAVLAAFLTSQVSPAFANRYFAAFVGPLLLVAAVGLANAARLGLICLVLVAAFWLDPRTGELESKSNARAVAASIATYVTAGDLVVSTHPERLPLMAYYLPQGVRYADSLGPVSDPRMFDWTDALERLKAARPTPTIDALVQTLRPGQEIVLIQPILRTGRWGAPWTSLVRRRSVQWERRLDADPRVRREAVVPVFGFDPLPKGVRAVVYRVR